MIFIKRYGLVAQLDRVFDYESKGRGFESRRAHEKSANLIINDDLVCAFPFFSG